MGNPQIYQPCAAITEFDTPELQQLITDMLDTMHEFDGVGIARPTNRR